MRLLTPSEEALEPRILLCTLTGMFRIKQVGHTFFVEQLHRVPRVEQGEVKHDDVWKVVSLSKPGIAREGKSPYQEAVEFMHNVDDQVLALIMKERKEQHVRPR